MQSTPIYSKELNENAHWFALHVRFKHEKKVHERLAAKAIESFLPTRQVLRQWSDRKKWIEEPLFRNYLFTKIALKNRLPVLQTDGVIRLVSFSGIPSVIPEWQIESIKKVLELSTNLEVLDSYIAGEDVEVISGPFSGLRGNVIKQKNTTRLYISIEAIGRSVGLEISTYDLRKVATQNKISSELEKTGSNSARSI